MISLSSCSRTDSRESFGSGGSPERWTLSHEPLLVLGGVAGSGLEMFESVVAAAWAEDGSILVADAGTDEIRLFGLDGVPLGAVGSRGPGPGEFGNLWGVFPGPGDTIWAYDQDRGITGFQRGEYQRDLEIYRGDPVGWVGNRVIAAGIPRLHRGRDPLSPGLHRDPWRVVAHTADGSAADTLIRGLSKEWFLSEDRIWGQPILGRDPYVALGSDFVAYGDGGSRGVLVLDLAGDTLVTIAVSEISGGPLDQLATARREARLEDFPPERRPRVRSVQATIPLPEWIADISDLAVDSDDHIWIRRMFKPSDPLVTWDVFDRAGTKVGWIQTPVRLTVQEIEGDKLLATDRDAFDVSRVLVYRIQK